jgi:hypothetical protein
MPYILTRIQTRDYDRWKPLFDQDAPGARAKARGHRVLRSQDDPNEVVVLVEFASLEDAAEGRARLIGSGVLERFDDVGGPYLLDVAESAGY